MEKVKGNKLMQISEVVKHKALLLVLFLIIFLATATFVYAATAVNLGTADSFAVLAGSGITNTGTTTITGDVGSYPTTTQTGFGSVTITGTNHAGDATTQGAKTALVTAYNDAAGQGPTNPIVANLGGQVLTPGVYNSASTIGLTGTLTLDGEGDPDAIFIFQAGSALTTASGSNISLINEAQSCNVFWQIGSDATLGTNSTFRGTLIALTSITVTTGTVVDGRVLARNGAVTLDTNTITVPSCAVAPTPTPTSSPTPGVTPTPTPAADSNSTVLGATTSDSSSSSTGGVGPCVEYEITTVPIIIDSTRISPTSILINWGPFAGLETFNVRYGLSNGEWPYNTDVTGFSTTINDLPANQPIWIQVAARNRCAIGTYGEPRFIGGPRLPNAGLAPRQHLVPWYLSACILLILSLFIQLRKSY